MTNTSIQTQENIIKQHSYKMFYPSPFKEGEQPLGEVIGHENQKKELLSVITWFKKSKELKAKGISIPKGVILFGPPGNGKSLLIKEIIKYADVPTFIFQGDQINIAEGIVDMFKQARSVGQSIIVIDELDLLINKERRVVRALQECLDGVESDDDILVLSATNNIDEIPDALLRNGRLEKLIEIHYPNETESIELFKKYFKEFNIELPDDFDEEETALAFDHLSCVTIKAIVNDIVLRNGFNDITTEMIDDSITNVTDRVKTSKDNNTIDIAIHEAGHALIAYSYPEHFIVNRLNLNGSGGHCTAKQVNEGFWPYDKIIADIKISLAGLIAQKILCGNGSRGCDSDLQHARISAYNLFNMCGYSSCWETLPIIKQGAREETFIKRRRMERKAEKLLRKCEKETTSYIKKHQKQVMALANLLLEKKHLKSSEIVSCLN